MNDACGPRPKMIQSSQPKNTFFAGNVKPMANSNLILSGGPDVPYYYSLGDQSTVPFVRFQGSGGTQKEFSWGEVIEVKPNEQVQVFSASYMPGDIQIQSGHDYANTPRRISIPVEIADLPANYFTPDGVPLPPGFIINPKFPCDTRRCKNAWLSVKWFTGTYPTTATDNDLNHVIIIGQNQQHTFVPEAELLSPIISPLFFNSGKKYYQDFILPALSQIGLIPLGYNAQASDPSVPHTLCDYAFFQIRTSTYFFQPNPEVPAVTGTGSIVPVFFYVLEY